MQTSPDLNVQEKIHRYHCPGCGADLVFEPRDGCLTCPYCGHTEQIVVADGKVEEHSYEEYLQPRSSQLQRLAQDALEVQCSSCGAIVTFTPPEVARECDFCGAKIVAQPKSADPLIAPEGVLPFHITKRQATDSIRQWLSSRWFDDGLIPATRSLSQDGLRALEPWDLPEVKPYEPAFLSGFKAQQYQVGLAEGFEVMKRIAAGVIDGDVRRDIGGDEQQVSRIS